MDVSQLTPNLSVCGQITVADLNQIADAGFTDVVCNRPDAEHPDGPVSQHIAKAARDLGLTFHYHPIVPGEPFETQAKALGRLMARADRKVLAYCRSGARAANAAALTA